MNIAHTYYSIGFLLLIVSNSCAQQVPTPLHVVKRVYVEHSSLPVQSAHGFTLISLDKDNKKQTITSPVITFSRVHNGIRLNAINTGRKQVALVPVDGVFIYAGQQYHGSLRVACSEKGMQLALAGRVVQPDPMLVPLPPSKHKQKNKNNKNKKPLDRAPAKTIPVADAPVATSIATLELPASQEEKPYAYNVRVLLDEQDAGTSKQWRLVSSQGFRVVDPDSATNRFELDDQELIIGQRNGAIFINGHKYYAKKLYIVPRSGFSAYDDKLYRGAMLVTCHNNSCMLINSLEIEDYVYCVLKTESWPGWPLEVNKAFAIASRSYVIAMVMRAKATKIPYHIKNTNAHQTYSGHHTSPILQQAVQETKGVFLSYNRQPIVAMFDICCGGIVPAKISEVDFVKAPYLQRAYACHHCKPTKMYQWQARYTESEIVKALKNDLPGLKHVKHLTVVKKDNAGLVKKLTLGSSKREFTITGKRLRILLPKIKSLHFTVKKEGNSFIFKGRGRGHHLGTCQWGAREMVRKGYTYKEVLDFYYPNTSFMRLAY